VTSPAPPPPAAPAKEPEAPSKPKVEVAEKAPPPPAKEAKVEEKKAAPEKGAYSLQVATLVKEESVRPLEKRLKQMGYSPRIIKGKAALSSHQVLVGEFASKEEADVMAKRLFSEGYSPTMVSLEGGRFSLALLSSRFIEEAIDLAHRLQGQKYSPRILSKRTATAVYRVRVGPFASREEALKKAVELRTQGLSGIVVKD